MSDILRRDYAEQLKQDYLKSGFKQGFEAGYAKAKEDFDRPHGEWIPLKNKKGETVAFRCSSCGQSPKYAVNSDFCPRCGSDNRKRGEAE